MDMARWEDRETDMGHRHSVKDDCNKNKTIRFPFASPFKTFYNPDNRETRDSYRPSRPQHGLRRVRKDWNQIF